MRNKFPNLLLLIFYIGLLSLLAVSVLSIFLKMKGSKKKKNIETFVDGYIEIWAKTILDGNRARIYKGDRGIGAYENGKEKIIFIAAYMLGEINVDKIKKDDPGAIIIILDGEPSNLENINLDKKDVVITTKKKFLPKEGNVIYFPEFALGFLKNLRIFRMKDNDFCRKNKFCYFAYSNCNHKHEGVRAREKFYKKMQEISGGRVDNLGKCLGGESSGSAGDNLKRVEYKFAIAFENEHIPGYITEKLINPRFAGSIPIYLGAPDVGLYFDTRSFIHVRDFPSFENCIEYVLRVDQNSELFNEILRRPFFKKESMPYVKTPREYIHTELRDSSASHLLKAPN